MALEPILYRDRNILKLIFNTTINCIGTKCSPEYTFDGFTLLQLKVEVLNANHGMFGNNTSQPYACSYYMKFKKNIHNDPLIYTLKVSSNTIGKLSSAKTFLSDDTDWRKLGETASCSKIDFDITMEVNIQCINSPFKNLYDELTDFELCGKGGSVNVHKAVLAGYSPVLKRMLISPGNFKEKVDNKIESPATKKTLDQLKSYMYLQQLPDDGLEDLAILGSYYEMTDLVTKCSIKLLFNLNTTNILSLLELGAQYKLNRLTIGILKNVELGFIKVDNLVSADAKLEDY